MSVTDDRGTPLQGLRATNVLARTWTEISAFRHELLHPVAFPDHAHDEHQLVWITRGNAMISTVFDAWLVSVGTAVWMPAGMPHTMSMMAPAEFHSLYIDPGAGLREHRWRRPHALEVDAVLGAIIARLESRTLTDGERGRTAAVLFDLLNESDTSRATLPVPRDRRAAIIAAALLDDPSDRRELQDWADELCVSAKTIARAFQSDTMLTFSAWRTRARIDASLVRLSAGASVEQVAQEIGYRTASAFIVAFRSQIGISPGAFARRSRTAVRT